MSFPEILRFFIRKCQVRHRFLSYIRALSSQFCTFGGCYLKGHRDSFEPLLIDDYSQAHQAKASV